MIFGMSKTIFKNLFSKPATVKYPVVPREYFKNTRGALDIDIDVCIFCGLCSRACPSDALAVDRNEKTWAVERMQCISCRACVDVCPKKCLELNSKYTSPSNEKVKDVFKQVKVENEEAKTEKAEAEK